jgi:hypothetical protein
LAGCEVAGRTGLLGAVHPVVARIRRSVVMIFLFFMRFYPGPF